MNERIKKYLLKVVNAEIVPSSEPDKNIMYISWEQHSQINKYLKRNNVPFSLRFNHDYSLAIYCL